MSETPQRPTSSENRDTWTAYWTAQGMPWRTEPEIDAARQAYLAARRARPYDITEGRYPFHDPETGGIPLTRADVEWLLATHDDHQGFVGPVVWSDPKQRQRVGLDLRGADLRDTNLSGLPLARLQGALRVEEGHLLSRVKRRGAVVHLENATLTEAHLEASELRGARFDGADLFRTHLEMAALHSAHFEGANLNMTFLQGADLRYAIFDSATNLHEVTVTDEEYGAFRLANVRWNGINLDRILWQQVTMLGDEQVARARRQPDGTKWTHAIRLEEYERAVRANRQLATVLRAQGLNEDADRFAYRAQVLQRRVLLRQRHPLRYLGSLLLALIAGYGYRPLRSFLAYAVVICVFAALYLLNGQFAAPHLSWDEALVLSISSFHGRGFFTTGVSLGDTLARLAATEAILGLLIEITFIATFTQRFFAR